MVDLFRQLAQALAGHYQLDREIGAGGMAVVYLARDLKHGRRVALKVLRPELAQAVGAERFLREIKLTARLDHPHILPLLDSGEAAGSLYYVMPYVEGFTLQDRLAREKRLPLDDALQITREVADGLGYAHRLGVVHRDIKPANILLSSTHARIADFGIARAVSEAGGESLTQTGLSIGTPAYMSPEQASGQQELDGRSDLYSLGCMLYEMLAGEPPHTGPTPHALLAKRLGGPVPRVSLVRETVPAAVDHAITTVLAKDPADRFATADQFVRALAGTTPMRPRWFRPAVAAGLATALAAGAGWHVLADGVRQGTAPRITATRPLTSLPGLETGPSWSPDGSKVAYVSDQSGNLDVWVQQVAAHQNVNLTQGHAGNDWHPAWSPDGDWIAYFSDLDDGGLYLVPAIGAEPRRILDAVSGLDFESGLAWSPDGTRLALSIGGALLVVPAAGGQAEPVDLPAEIVRWKIIDVTWTPAGDRITFVARAAAGLSTSAIWSVRPDGSGPIQVTAGTSFDRNPLWTPDGRGLYFVSDRGGNPDLWYVAVDGSGRSSGDPSTLTVGAGVGAFALAADGRQIAYAKESERANIWSLPILDRPMSLDDARPITDENHFIELLALSPDGKRIAFDSDRSGNADIWTIGVDGRGLRQITADPAHDWAPRWSPDGRRIGYHSLRSGNRDLWAQPVQGGPAVQLTNDPAQDWTISWSPDGRTIVFGSGRSGTVQLWRMPAAGGEATQLTTIGAVWWYPVWSPDGRTIAFASDTTGHAEIYLVTLAGAETRQLTKNRWQKGFPVAFSADGQTLYACGSTTPGLDRLDVWAIDTGDGSARRLTDFSATRLELFNATMDAGWIYATFRDRIGDLWVVDLELEPAGS